METVVSESVFPEETKVILPRLFLCTSYSSGVEENNDWLFPLENKELGFRKCTGRYHDETYKNQVGITLQDGL